MADLETTQRIPTSSSTTPLSTAENYVSKGPHHEKHISFVFPFNIPSSSEAAAVRIIGNLGTFGLWYAHFVWIILFITLIPRWDYTPLIRFVMMTYMTSLYCLLLRTWPNSTLLHTTIDKRFVLALLAIATAMQLILNDAGLNLAGVLASCMPLVLVHAVFWVGLDAFKVEDGASVSGERAPIVSHNESGASASDHV